MLKSLLFSEVGEKLRYVAKVNFLNLAGFTPFF